MIIRKLKKIKNTKRDVSWGNGNSKRFLLKEDNVGFTFTETVINAGTESIIEYKKHIEACYCIEGEGEIKEEDGKVHKISPGTLYALDKHDKHHLKAKTKMKLVCVFLPALVGGEKHDMKSSKSSSY